MAVIPVLLPLLFLLAAPAAGQIRRVEIVPVPPPFIQAPPMLMNMVNMMERVVNELMPEPMLPPAAGPEIIAEVKPVAPVAAGDKSRTDESARPPPHEDPIDIKREPLDGPELPSFLPFPRVEPEHVMRVPKKGQNALRKRLNATASEHSLPHHKVAILEITRTNSTGPVLQAVALGGGNKSIQHKSSGSVSTPPSSPAPKSKTSSSLSSKEAARLPANSAAQQLQDETGPAAAIAALGELANSAESTKQGAQTVSSPGVRDGSEKPTDPASSSSENGLAATCYGIFLRHGVVILVLGIVCGASCLMGALLPVLCKRARVQVSQYPPKRHFIPGRIFADPAMTRMFRRRENMVA